jgi:eukaryotic-like serine/threonine-protein kinase
MLRHMPLSLGSRVGRYEVTGTLGAGGMGEVYRARDARLNRDVAIKSLPESVAHDPERVARFEREAQLLASLNHPHIAAVYGVEDAGALQFIVLELVEGGTLADRLARGALPQREALQIARNVADALSSAHEKGIVHRDLKPANIALTTTGDPKVLDFGLAKSGVPDADSMTIAATQTGVVLGTAPYMSPEQARGEAVDRRSDIWSFGCVLFEMLAGRRPFAGPSTSELVVAILEREPDFNALPATTPARIRWLLRRCLEKDRRRRLHDIADARIEIEDVLGEAGSGSREATRGIAVARPSVGRREMAAWGLALAALAFLVWALAAGRSAETSAVADRVSRTSIAIPEDMQLAPVPPAGRFALSPDGRRLVFVALTPTGSSILWLRSLDSLTAQPLPGTEGAAYPFWSPDSRWIAFVARSPEAGNLGQRAALKKVEVSGGQPITLTNQAFGATGAWNRDNIILFTPSGNGPIVRLSAVSPGTPTPVTTLEPENGDVQHSYPSFLPDGQHFLYTVIGSRGAATHARAVYVGSLDGKPPRLVMDGGSNAKYANGYLLFTREATLFAQRFALASMQLQGEAVPISERVQVSDSAERGSLGGFSVSDAGWLVYQAGRIERSQIEWISRDGARRSSVGEPEDVIDVTLSPNGSRAAMSVVDRQLGTRDIWILDVERGSRERLTAEPSDEYAPVWSPDGNRIVYSSGRQGRIELFERKASGSSPERKLDTGGLALGKFAASWSRDGRALLYVAGGRILARSDIYVINPDGSGPASPWLESGFIETQPRFSRDSRWVAYSTNESERMQVYVRRFAGPGDATRVSINGGAWPRWRADGSEIFFVAPDGTLMAASVTATETTIAVGDLRPLFKARLRLQGRLDGYPYDVSADGQRFLVNNSVEQAGAVGLTLMTNWTAAVR